MKKIMFNDRYGLTKAVLEGRKTMTRRIIKAPNRTIEGKEVCGFAINKTTDGVPYEVWLTGPDEESLCQLLPTYKVGEVVAVAQKYKDVPNPFYGRGTDRSDAIGWENKMFVKAEDMPHHIRITGIKVERLQDISDEDVRREGVWLDEELTRLSKKNGYGEMWRYSEKCCYASARGAFAALIDKVSGKGTWESNPWVFAYSFELVKGGEQ